MYGSKKNVFQPAASIVEDDVNLPQPANLIRAANLYRQNMQPKDPTDLNFDVILIIIYEDDNDRH
ncbi:hypothetical protein DPMN_006599 [Dreissena polymorpha]|uniref:Uncharacterized protein n=1 Tax=Dreissena polymorpha TaxID=45954 RepID=A0A9D4MUW5_DREPO|nr:hypothetical protein DPMN_006599 [Dreissena polymorpha]